MNTATNLQEKHKASIRVMQFVILIGSIILIGRIFHLQILYYETYSPMSMQNSLRMGVVSPARGLSYGRNGVILVENEPIYSVTITPSKFDSDKFPLLAEILDLPEETVKERIAAAQNYSWHRTSRLFTEVSFETFSALQENAWQLPGISHQVESKRYYPTEVKAPHVFGYMREASREEHLADARHEPGYDGAKTET